jgi:uncharacterized protein (DUF362 family)
MALCGLLLAAGARRVRFVESAPYQEPMEQVLEWAGWDVETLLGLGNVEVENTRNLGEGKKYSPLRVPTGGYLFSHFELNHSYADTDFFISLAKLKNHTEVGATLSMKNLFGITPNALYGDQAPNEQGLSGRQSLHEAWLSWFASSYPGQKSGRFPNDGKYRVPRIIADLCATRPVDLAIIDGITAMSGGEGPWAYRLKFTTPGVLIAGLNPVSTDAVALAVMGYPDPRAGRGTPPFGQCDNHILLGEQAGLGTANLSQIDLRGLGIAQVKYPYG